MTAVLPLVLPLNAPMVLRSIDPVLSGQSGGVPVGYRGVRIGSPTAYTEIRIGSTSAYKTPLVKET